MSVHVAKTDPHFDSIGQASLNVVAKAAKAKAAKQSAAYAYWQEGLILGAGRELTREQQKLLGIHDGDPRPGFYRKRNKAGKDDAVAIWNDETGIIALVNGEPADPVDIWTYVARWPISHEQYEAVMDGAPWPDDGPARAEVGHNLPDDPHEAAKIEFEGEKEAAEEILARPIKTQADADRAAVAAKRLSDLHGKVDKMFRAEKDPINLAGREVDEKFRWREDAKALSVKLKRAQDDFLREQDRLEKERQRKAREEAERIQREADEARVAAEKAMAKKVADGISDAQAIAEHSKRQEEADRLAAAAAAKAREAEAQKVSAGRTGARVSLRTFVDAVIVDYPALVEALRDRQEMKELVQSLANRAAKAGVELPGMKIRSTQRAA
jgi:hypothetical protein